MVSIIFAIHNSSKHINNMQNCKMQLKSLKIQLENVQFQGN